MQSGTVETMPPGHVHKEGQAQLNALPQALNIPLDLGWEEKMTRLRTVETEVITLAGSGVAAAEYGPRYDNGKVFPVLTTPFQTKITDQLAYDPNIKSIMVGANRDEGNGIARFFFGDCSLKNYPNIVQKFAPLPKLVAQFESVYGTPETDVDVSRIAEQAMGDLLFHYPTQVLCDTLQERIKVHGGKGFKFVRYHFDAEIQKMNEILPVFGPPMVEAVLTEQELKLSKAMQALWIGFANQQDYEVMPRSGEEAVVMTNDYSIEIGKSKRLTDQVMLFWRNVSQLKVQATQEGFLNREE
ncbi:hypothetical protein BGZ51_001033 [Haplosporangium sp. Z 767]|nr:hypothetical protein BGZ51_001033 [Haplosporangium sp. Z 767]KAF9193114.1 hypothetical protein BGZ50_007800 [Haplosporangium sp. Z 11]